MSRRSAATILAAIAALLTLTTPVAAKDGFEARLDTPVPVDSRPGTTLTIGWTVAAITGDTELPMIGSPVFIRLVPPGGGDRVVATGVERPSGSGHYVAEIRVPAGGIAAIEIGLHGESTVQGASRASDILFPITGQALVSGAAGAAAATAAPLPPAAAAPVARATTAPLDPVAAPRAVAPPTAVDAPWALLAVAALAAVAAVVALASALARRGRRPSTAGNLSSEPPAA